MTSTDIIDQCIVGGSAMTPQADISKKRWLPTYLRSMIALKVGESVDLLPEDGDTLDALWQRVQRQAARYRLAGMYFHRLKRNDRISVQRVEQGGQKKLAPFLRLEVGEKMPCRAPFDSDNEKRNLRRRLLHLTSKGQYIWVEQHKDGQLYFRCFARTFGGCPSWIEQLTDDGSDLKAAKVVCCPSDLLPAQQEFTRIKIAILKNRALSGVLCS